MYVDTRAALEWADVSVMCSTAEAFGKVTVESLLAGTPVIGYDSGGTPEIAKLGGVKLIEPTVDALTAAIELIVHDPSELVMLRQSIIPNLGARLAGNASRALHAALGTEDEGHAP